MAELLKMLPDVLTRKLEKGTATVRPPDNVVTVVEQVFEGETGCPAGTRTFNLTREHLVGRRNDLRQEAANALATADAIDMLLGKLWPGASGPAEG